MSHLHQSPPMMDPRHDMNGFQMPNMQAPPLMNPPPQIFGAYGHDGLGSIDLSQPLFGDGTLLDESNEAKRRRIARVGHNPFDSGSADVELTGCRRVICVGRRRSSAMERCRPARTASTTKQNVCSRRWKRRGILPRGMQKIEVAWGKVANPGQGEIYRGTRESAGSNGKSA